MRLAFILASCALWLGCSGAVRLGEDAATSGGAGAASSSGVGGAPATCDQGEGGLGLIACGSHCTYEYLFCADCATWCPEQCATRCGPFVILASVSSPGPIALDDTTVYFGTGDPLSSSAGGTVMAVPKAGAPPVTLVPAQGVVVSLAVDAQFVYWVELGSGSEGGPLKMAPKQGGAPTVLVDAAMGLATDPTHLYYWRKGPALEAMPLGGGTPVVVTTSVSASGIVDIAVDGTHVYWIDRDASGSTIHRVPLAGGAVEQLVSTPSPFTLKAMTLDATSLYWLDTDTPQTLRRAALDGTSPTALFTSGEYTLSYLAVDATAVTLSVFGGVTDGSSIERIPLAGGAATKLAAGPAALGPEPVLGAVHGLAVDANAVYWTSQLNEIHLGYVLKVPK